MKSSRKAIDGGIISFVHNAPFGPRSRFLVAGTWTGGTWPFNELDPPIALQYRGGQMLGGWKMVGIGLSGFRGEPAVLVEPQSAQSHELVAGDAFVFGGGFCTRSRVISTTLPMVKSGAVLVGRDGYQGVVEVTHGVPKSVTIFHDSQATIERAKDTYVEFRGEKYSAEFEFNSPSSVPFTIELYSKKDAVPASFIVDVVAGLRGFSLAAGQELLYGGVAQKKRRVQKAAYDNFDIDVAAASGSFHAYLSVHPKEKMPLRISPDEPLKLAWETLQALGEGDSNRAIDIISSRVFSVNSLLKKLKSVAAAATKVDSTLTRTEGREPLDAARVLESLDSLSVVESRMLERSGLLYALDSKHRWFRVACTVDDKAEDWTIRFSLDKLSLVSGRVPRQVKISLKTRTQDTQGSGKGELVDLEELADLHAAT